MISIEMISSITSPGEIAEAISVAEMTPDQPLPLM
jgi:hypothetical protein